MAKIFKVSGYIVDVNGDSNVDEVIAEVSPGFDGMINQHIHVEEADIGKWNDESPLNYDNCDLADCEKYFKRKVPVDNDRNVMAGQVYRHFKGHTVKVLHIAQDTEAPGQFCVVYECEDGAIWSRPYGMPGSSLYDIDAKVRQIKNNIADCKREIRMLKSYTTAYNPEAIVKKLEGKIEYAGRLMVEKPADKLDEIANNTAEDYIQAYTEAIELVKGGGNIEQPGI